MSVARGTGTLSSLRLLLATALVLGALPARALAQSESDEDDAGRRVHVELAAGALFGNPDVGVGYAGMAALELRSPIRAVALRGDFSAGRLPADRRGTISIASTTASLVLYPLRGSALRPYLLGGLGYYAANGSDAGSSGWTFNTTNAFNVGAGIAFALAGRGAFIEMRWHRILSGQPYSGNNPSKPVSLAPLMAGITF